MMMTIMISKQGKRGASLEFSLVTGNHFCKWTYNCHLDNKPTTVDYRATILHSGASFQKSPKLSKFNFHIIWGQFQHLDVGLGEDDAPLCSFRLSTQRHKSMVL